jgi:hypothetical protein
MLEDAEASLPACFEYKVVGVDKEFTLISLSILAGSKVKPNF